MTRLTNVRLRMRDPTYHWHAVKSFYVSLFLSRLSWSLPRLSWAVLLNKKASAQECGNNTKRK